MAGKVHTPKVIRMKSSDPVQSHKDKVVNLPEGSSSKFQDKVVGLPKTEKLTYQDKVISLPSKI